MMERSYVESANMQYHGIPSNYCYALKLKLGEKVPMRTRLSLLVATTVGLLMAGCTTTAAKQVYTDDSGTKMIITGDSVAGKVTILVNGEPVISNAPVYSKHISGSYRGKKVTATCKMHTKAFGSEQECDIYVDEQYAGNLYFR
jgi:hypothetical protein